MKQQLAQALLISSLATVAIASPAQALDFFFSFNNDDLIPSTVPGTVSGRILGLTDNATGSATSIIIDDFPMALGGTFVIGSDAAAWTIDEHSFTVINGNITAANFEALAGPNIFCLNAFVPSGQCANGSVLTLDAVTTRVVNNGGFAAITFTPVPFEFEASLGLIALGAMAGGYAYSKKRKANKKIAA
ncbi:hypothetical protein Pse7367_3874 (plasmid) [Thalassoporum mexicanum PCC 7367]|uniref:PFE-CTERM domain-containing protein n=1 Tax=Thalassoporum mexicanum TaxID=3457544 RepID=UPI00029FA1AF|nr:hypothetical protein [Pseudanabaena sp. PCC 7367]AFY72097.1 hypothetical protein Pse7367_3874 [Pseudanabaena sp. PCC 7367]